MNWELERDALLARTMAFVQFVAGKKETEDARPEFRSDGAGHDSVPTAPPRVADHARGDPPPPAVRLSRPKIPSEVQREIQDRIANFRAHQERFNRERAEYFNATLARLRAAIDDAAPR
jgi:hypothetical protein